MKKTITLLTGLVLLFNLALQAQDTLTKDPLLKFSKFYEVNLATSLTRVNTNHTVFNTDNGTYTFMKNNYTPALEGGLMFGMVLSDKDDDVWMIKTGMQFLTRNANLIDTNRNDLQLSTGYLQIPILAGIRLPLQHHKERNGYYRAVDVYVGPYMSAPMFQKLDSKDNVDSEMEAEFFSYLRFGFMSEIMFTSLNQRGNGHKFGIRASSDFTYVHEFKETDTQLYPYYYSIGVFYNLINLYN